jgi:hypothetical protein
MLFIYCISNLKAGIPEGYQLIWCRSETPGKIGGRCSSLLETHLLPYVGFLVNFRSEVGKVIFVTLIRQGICSHAHSEGLLGNLLG